MSLTTSLIEKCACGHVRAQHGQRGCREYLEGHGLTHCRCAAFVPVQVEEDYALIHAQWLQYDGGPDDSDHFDSSFTSYLGTVSSCRIEGWDRIDGLDDSALPLRMIVWSTDGASYVSAPGIIPDLAPWEMESQEKQWLLANLSIMAKIATLDRQED